MSEGLVATLKRLGACDPAIKWVALQEGSAYDLWRRCERGDWLLWLAARVGVDRRLVVQVACACAREALVHVPEGETRPLRAIETAEAWCRGEASIEDVRSAADATWGAYAAADAMSSYEAILDAAAAAYAAAYAAADAADAYAADARAASHATRARRVRRIIPWRLVRDGLRQETR